MRRFAAAALLAIAMTAGALDRASAQIAPPPPLPGRGVPVGVGTVRGGVPVVGWYAMGSVFCAAVAPIIGTAVLGRELTYNEVYRSTFGCVLGPLGWLIADWLVPPDGVTPGRPGHPRGPPRRLRQGRGRNITVPPAGETRFVANEVLLEFRAGASALRLSRMAQALQLTHLETQSFLLTGRTLQRWRIDAARSVRATLLAMRRFGIVAAAQPNWFYFGTQNQAASTLPNVPQYVVGKLHLTEAHRITDGDDVLVAVIDSQIDTHHPDLAGVFAGEYDALATQAAPHAHGTAIAGAIASHSKLVGVAPKVRLLAVRAFSGSGAGAEGTTFNVLKGLDWAASKNARIVNMSFAGPADAMLRDMLARAYARGMVLIAAVGNAGPRSPPLYPAAYRDVIGVTAIDVDDKLLPQANRGPQVAFAAPGVAVIEPAPGNSYQVTSGTSVAAAHASGVAALVLARDPKLKPAAVRRIMMKGARRIAGNRRDVGSGEIDALGALKQLAP
jgi:subtilisin family serine protease